MARKACAAAGLGTRPVLFAKIVLVVIAIVIVVMAAWVISLPPAQSGAPQDPSVTIYPKG